MIETSKLFWIVNRLAGFYMMGKLVVKEITRSTVNIHANNFYTPQMIFLDFPDRTYSKIEY